jgi:hypothetical protein
MNCSNLCQRRRLEYRKCQTVVLPLPVAPITLWGGLITAWHLDNGYTRYVDSLGLLRHWA